MKKLILILLTSFLLFSISAELVDRIVAKVGSDIILLSDVYKMMYQMQAAGIPKEQISVDMALQEIIEQKVITQKAKELNIKVDEDKIKRYAQNYLQELKSQYPSPQDFQAALVQENLTEAELLEYFIEEIKNNAMTQQLIDLYVSSQVSVTEEEMQEFYNATKDTMAVKPTTWETGMIKYRIAPSKATEDSIYVQMQEIKKRIDAGLDFATLASEVMIVQ
jgi:peptidyl-prolyl cis-trans isomerase SurA